MGKERQRAREQPRQPRDCVGSGADTSKGTRDTAEEGRPLFPVKQGGRMAPPSSGGSGACLVHTPGVFSSRS